MKFNFLQNHRYRLSFVAVLSLATVLFAFNNCSDNVKFSKVETQDSSGASGTANPPDETNNTSPTTNNPPPPQEPIPPVDYTPPNTTNTVVTNPPPPPTEPEGPAVCDPFANGGQNTGTSKNGIEGKLFYFESQPSVLKTSYFIEYGLQIPDLTIYLSQINVPTRVFSSGFSTDDGSTLKNAAGQTLVEWFGLQLKGQIGLTANDEEGDYQFAAISDDGIVFRISKNGTLETYFADDNDHATLMTCSVEPVSLTRDKKLPFELNYFQGPKYEIALMLLWRKFPTQGGYPIIDRECGKSDNSYFFDFTTTPSTPKATYQGLLSRGWAPVPAQNFFLNENAKPNPCVTQ